MPEMGSQENDLDAKVESGDTSAEQVEIQREPGEGVPAQSGEGQSGDDKVSSKINANQEEKNTETGSAEPGRGTPAGMPEDALAKTREAGETLKNAGATAGPEWNYGVEDATSGDSTQFLERAGPGDKGQQR